MGITNFTTTIAPFLHECSVELYTELPKYNFFNLIVDGNWFLHLGNVGKNYLADKIQKERWIARNAICILTNKLEFLAKYSTLNKLYIYTDGYRPKMKISTQYKRSKHATFCVGTAMKYFMENITKLFDKNQLEQCVSLHNLHKGESEIELYLHRPSENEDDNIVNIIYTNDTDIFHIAYGDIGSEYNLNQQNLLLRKINNFRAKSNNTVYIMNKLHEVLQIHPLFFRCINFCQGSDFLMGIFTTSMVKFMMKLIYSFNFSENKWIENRSFNAKEIDILNKEHPIVKESLQRIQMISQNYIHEEKYTRSYIVDLPNIIEVDEEKTDSIRLNNVYSEKDVEEIVTLMVKLLDYCNRLISFAKIHNCRKSESKKISNAFKNDIQTDARRMFIESLTWCVNYSLCGCRYAFYNELKGVPRPTNGNILE